MSGGVGLEREPCVIRVQCRERTKMQITEPHMITETVHIGNGIKTMVK